MSQLALAAYLAEADPPKRETLHILATPSLLNHPLPVQLCTKERGKAYLGVPTFFEVFCTFNTSHARDGLLSAELPIRSNLGTRLQWRQRNFQIIALMEAEVEI